MASQSVKSQDYWQKRAQEIRRLRDQEIARFVQTRAQRVQDKFGQPKILEIIKKNVGELRTMVIQEEIDIIDLLDVFWTRALTIGLKLGALADIDLDGTLQLAEGLKRQLESTPKADRDSKLGLLFGVPISLKENLKLKGTYSTLGVTAFAEAKETSNSLLVDMVIKHGGVPFVKSNVPMMLKTTESVNNIYGRALNPWNLDRTAGGSSGGESSLIASFCSPAGYGGDIGGSIRTPCHYTGLWGIKPTIERVTIDAGRMISHTGKRFSNTCMVGVSGPMARTVDDIVRMFKVMVDEEVFQRDPQVYRLPFNDHLYLSSKKIKIGKTSADLRIH